MSFDSLVANAGRLRILTALAVENRQEFVQLRRSTHLTDGNLSAHARRLQVAGLVEIEKTFREGKPVTRFTLTEDGRQRLTAHVSALMSAISASPISEHVMPRRRGDAAGPIDTREHAVATVDEWVD
jgi:DNA-binding MarR family transcriptional regulator